MFEDLPQLNQYQFIPDEAYLSEAPFETTAGFMKYLANDSEDELSVTDEILVFELKEGVFIRSRNARWSEALSSLAKKPVANFPRLKLYAVKKLDDLTRDYRRPLNSFGDYRLMRWKVGF